MTPSVLASAHLSGNSSGELAPFDCEQELGTELQLHQAPDLGVGVLVLGAADDQVRVLRATRPSPATGPWSPTGTPACTRCGCPLPRASAGVLRMGEGEGIVELGIRASGRRCPAGRLRTYAANTSPDWIVGPAGRRSSCSGSARNIFATPVRGEEGVAVSLGDLGGRDRQQRRERTDASTRSFDSLVVHTCR